MGNTRTLLVNIPKIEEELILSDVLVTNRIEPYYSLSCLKKTGDYDFEFNCVPCPRFSKCMGIFVNGGYVIDTSE
jgi:hypothetical protein